MPLTTKIGGLELSAVGSRAALREKLLKIVGLVPGVDRETTSCAPLVRTAPVNHGTLLLFDKTIDDISAIELNSWIRRRNPGTHVAFVNFEWEFQKLPCEFAEGPQQGASGGENRVARAAAAHWRCIDRGFAVARTINRICAKRLEVPTKKR